MNIIEKYKNMHIINYWGLTFMFFNDKFLICLNFRNNKNNE